jgi:hypothetical protein
MRHKTTLELEGTNFDNSKRNYNIEKIQYKNCKSLKKK